ncbi:MAG: hypothetical protein JO250_14365 [Armatimonadetes bacterium]|nr:hypothetical protein [Armatimonadota bacterium]
MTVLEGTWEEVARHAPELAGRRVRLTVLEEAAPAPPNEGMLAALRLIEQRQQGRQETSSEDTQRLLRDARDGGMYGLDPSE